LYHLLSRDHSFVRLIFYAIVLIVVIAWGPRRTLSEDMRAFERKARAIDSAPVAPSATMPHGGYRIAALPPQAPTPRVSILDRWRARRFARQQLALEAMLDERTRAHRG
jgi:hypothetical protein